MASDQAAMLRVSWARHSWRRASHLSQWIGLLGLVLMPRRVPGWQGGTAHPSGLRQLGPVAVVAAGRGLRAERGRLDWGSI